MSSATLQPRTARRAGLGSLAAVTIAALVTLVSGGAAHAADWTVGHIDLVYAEAIDGSTLDLRTNVDPGPSVPAGTWDIIVPNTPALGGYVLPEDQNVANTLGLPWVGFAGDPNLITNGALVDQEDLTVELVSVVHTNPDESPGSGAVTVSQDSVVWYAGAADTHDFTVTDDPDEAYHEHAEWEFTLPGTYVLTFAAFSAGAVTASNSSYTFVVG